MRRMQKELSLPVSGAACKKDAETSRLLLALCRLRSDGKLVFNAISKHIHLFNFSIGR